MLPWWNKLYLIFVVYFKLGLTWSTYILSSSWDRAIIKAIILLLFKVEHNSQQEHIFIEILISFNRPKRPLRRSLRGHMPQNSPKIWALVELMLKKMTYFQFSTWETGAYFLQVYKPMISQVRNTEFEAAWCILQSQQFQSSTVAHFDFTEQTFEAFLAHLYS